MQNRRTLLLRPRKYSETGSDMFPLLYFWHKSSSSLSIMEKKDKREANSIASTSQTSEALTSNQENFEELHSKVASFFDFSAETCRYEEYFGF